MHFVKEDSKVSLELLNKKALLLPELPGCYLMLNKDHEVIYVGKAKNLKNRVTSYFNNSSKSIKTQRLVSNICDFEFKLAESEAHALVIENNLIKKFHPKYNILLRDDKTYPYLVIDWEHEFPQILYTRKFRSKKNQEILGPFVHGSNVVEVLQLVQKIFQIRICTDSEYKKRKRPCLLHQMQHCSAPCVGLADRDLYRTNLEIIRDFFRGKVSSLITYVETLMHQKAENEQFEYAAHLRDSLQILNLFATERFANIKVISDTKSFDVIGHFFGESTIDLSIYMVRNGIELGHKSIHFELSECVESFESHVNQLLLSYYSNLKMDSKINVYFDDDNISLNTLNEAMLLDEATKNISMASVPSSLKQMFILACANAKESQRVRLEQGYWNIKALDKLQSILKLNDRPIVIECYDIAIWQGDSPTGSQVVFRNGMPDKSEYRHYNLTKRPEGNNDFEMMKELLERRLNNGKLPDLIVVDGGLGQLNVASTLLKELKLEIPVVGLAKERTKGLDRDSDKAKKSEERLFLVGRKNPIYLSKEKELLKLMVFVRNEAHRFSRRLHHKKERERIFGDSNL